MPQPFKIYINTLTNNAKRRAVRRNKSSGMAISVPSQLNLAFLSLLLFLAFQDISGMSLDSEFLKPQNEARATVGEKPLVWDEKLEEYAREYAEQRRADCELRHSGGPYGENIFWGSGSGWKPEDAVAAWVGEDRLFNYHTHSCNGYMECGHYTQIVWKSTRSVGCASVTCFDGDTFIACNYDPPGNYLGQKPY